MDRPLQHDRCQDAHPKPGLAGSWITERLTCLAVGSKRQASERVDYGVFRGVGCAFAPGDRPERRAPSLGWRSSGLNSSDPSAALAKLVGSARAAGVGSHGWTPTGGSTHNMSASPERVALLAGELVERLDVCWHILDPAVVDDRDGKHAHAALASVCDDSVIAAGVLGPVQQDAANDRGIRRVAVAIGVRIDHDQ